MSDIILRTLDLTKRYKNRLAVDHLNIEVRQGDIIISYSEWQVNTGLDDQLFKN